MTDGTEVLRLGGPKQRAVLALLALHANEVVSTDRLLDALWDGIPPDEPALHAHVSRLRKALGDPSSLRTRPPGYVLELDGDQLDLLRFETLVDRARVTLADGEAEQAAADLREALALWRGRPLADLEDEPLYRVAAERLDGIWLDAVELRVEADLALGRHAALATELTALVRRHPYRERLRAQLMLALYRSGRQTEALEVYTDGRRRLGAELGLEPGPELRRLQLQILEHDAALDLPSALARRRRPIALALAVTAALAAVAVALVFRDGAVRAPPAVANAGGLFAIDAGAGRAERRATVGGTPAAVALGEGAVWVLDADERTVTRVDERTGASVSFATGATPTDVATGAGAVWVADGEPLGETQFGGAIATSVARVDPATRTVRARAQLPRPERAVSGLRDATLAVEPDVVWALAPDGALARIDPRTSRVVAVIRGVQARAVAAGPEGVWLLGEDGTIARVDPERNAIVQRERIPASAVGSLALGAGAAWVSAPGDGTLWRVDVGERLQLRTVDVGRGVTDVAFGAGRVWLVNPLQSTVTSVDPERNAMVDTLTVPGVPRALAVAGDTVWVASAAAAEPAPVTAGDAPLPRSVCGPVLSAAGGYDHLVVSDLPLQGNLAFSAQQMEQAIAFTLRERGFRAGRWRLGYQACDDSTARTGLFDPIKCAANAHRYATTERVLAVVGWVNSPCALAALPELSQAHLAAVSPLATAPELTRPVPEEVERLYPGGRNFARVAVSDDDQARVLAEVAADTGAQTVATVDDGDPAYGGMLAATFAGAARDAGLTVVARQHFDPQGASYAPVARAVARAAPDAVFVGSFLDAGGGRVVRALRDALAPEVELLLPEGFTPVPLLRKQAGAAAEGAYLAVSSALPEASHGFVRRFGVTQPGLKVEPSAVLAAQATTVVLDAIARSDGTRASVVDALFETRLDSSLLGDVAFDAGGDLRRTPGKVVRVGGG